MSGLMMDGCRIVFTILAWAVIPNLITSADLLIIQQQWVDVLTQSPQEAIVDATDD